MTIRRATEADLGALMAMERSIAEAPHWSERQYREVIATGSEIRRAAFVAEVEQASVAGFAVGRWVPNEAAELESVAVVERRRRYGVGRALCEAVIDWALEQGAGAMELEVREGSAGAIRMYELLGFRRTGERPRYYRDPIEGALLMRLDLSEATPRK